MPSEVLEREANYQTAMLMFRSLLDNGIITIEDYAKAERLMREKYKPIVGVLFYDIELT